MICLDEMLYGEPTWEQIKEFFKDGEFCGEEYSVQAIKKYLRTEEQRQSLNDRDLSIEDMLNGRYEDEEFVHGIYKDWNSKLGFKCFGS